MVKKILILAVFIFIVYETYCCYSYMKRFCKKVNKKYECIYDIEKLP
ncbi:hypothetical protein PM10SUCC1_00060 [Propionigenium maris DSM 9537]|uniref:Uncharacterized protein n=1 Tax=Propionigenium maris DSM 9537 TaxID=1123000 RepID=A0A9W6GII1_9FUSO|nr:hypothetical protein [Propionigenium maris]GLI54491.1 hypothetical protein PM10SUCC1_00060 [Propionigenium maris DSM 9537]